MSKLREAFDMLSNSLGGRNTFEQLFPNLRLSDRTVEQIFTIRMSEYILASFFIGIQVYLGTNVNGQCLESYDA